MDSLVKLVHIDLKGAAIKLDYLKELLPLLKKYGSNGLLMEYEDMFPYHGEISFLARSDAYGKKELQDFLDYCTKLNVMVIPLVQTFGHMEFVLKHEKLRHLRENLRYPMTICPSLKESTNLIKDMINQIISAHSNIRYLHIGADEVFDINVCHSCQIRDLDKPRIFLEHIINTASFVKKAGLQPIIWDDMLRDIDPHLVKSVRLGDIVEPMVWNYSPMLALPDQYLETMLATFPRMWAASAYKGANGAVQQIVNTSVYVKNNQSWAAKIKSLNQGHGGKIVGIALTGWSRFDHFACLCELLPASIPCLILCLEIVTSGAFTVEMHDRLSKELGFPELIPWEPLIKCVDPACVLLFPAFEVYQGLSGWFLLSCEYNQLINSDYMNGWMSKWHRDRLIGNNATVEQLVRSLSNLHKRFADWLEIFEKSFRRVLTESAVDEWVQVHVRSRMGTLAKRVRQGGQVVALGDSVFDRSRLGEGEAAGDR